MKTASKRGNYKALFFILLIAGAFLLRPFAVKAQSQNDQTPKTTRILFMFDASFSMFGQWQHGMKIDIAKNILSKFIDSLQTRPHLEMALRVFGAQYPLRPVRNCKDSKLMVPFAPNNGKKIETTLDNIVPKGTTPIAYSLEQCANDFPPRPNCRNIVILITDGIEECGGDPCAVSHALQSKGIILKPFIIGIGANENYSDAYSCVGKYFGVDNEANFKTIMNVVISEALNNTTAQVNLLDVSGKPTETDVDMTFYDQLSGQIRYNYMHTINNLGNPDTLVLDPVETYRLVVHTIPPVEKDSITLVAGKHNIIGLNAPQGYLHIKTSAESDYKGLSAIIRKHGEMQTLNVQSIESTEKYIVGKYDLEILTRPRIYLNAVKVKERHTTTIEIPQAGVLTVLKPSPGPGSIYLETADSLSWVYNLNTNMTQESVVLQPGNYRIEYRPNNAKQSIYTVERRFKISSGESTPVQLY